MGRGTACGRSRCARTADRSAPAAHDGLLAARRRRDRKPSGSSGRRRRPRKLSASPTGRSSGRPRRSTGSSAVPDLREELASECGTFAGSGDPTTAVRAVCRATPTPDDDASRRSRVRNRTRCSAGRRAASSISSESSTMCSATRPSDLGFDLQSEFATWLQCRTLFAAEARGAAFCELVGAVTTFVGTGEKPGLRADLPPCALERACDPIRAIP